MEKPDLIVDRTHMMVVGQIMQFRNALQQSDCNAHLHINLSCTVRIPKHEGEYEKPTDASVVSVSASVKIKNKRQTPLHRSCLTFAAQSDLTDFVPTTTW